MESKDFLANFTGNLASDTVKLLIKKLMELKHSRDNYHPFRDMLNEMHSHLMEIQSSSSQYHTQLSPAIERCTKEVMAVLEEAKTQFPGDPPRLLGGLTLHSNMEDVKMKLESGFKKLDLELTRQDLISKLALLQPPKPLMQPEPETGFIGGVIKTLEKRMLELLHHDNPAQIIVVHGLGGVGKTTLLYRVYNSVIEESTDFSFSSKSWLTISQEYNVAKLQRTLAEDVGMQVKDTEDEERLKMRLADSFKTRKFFVVLDDLWFQDFDVRKLGLPFGNEHQGSKVVITTRNITVARNMGFTQFTEHIEVPTLNEEDSWELFRRSSFESLDMGSLSEEKLSTAKTVCKECKGLPLAIKVVARSFFLNRTLNDQQLFLTQLRKANPVFVGSEQGELFNKLKLSYDLLPNSELKNCFLYTACMFAEDAEIHLSKLIRMWICEGFVGCEDEDGYYSSIQLGIYYFKILYYRCLISISRHTYDLDNEYQLLTHGAIKVHDCIRDMAMIVGKDDAHSYAFKSYLPSAGNFKRLSLHRSCIAKFQSHFGHSNMITLNLSETRINKVPNDFFTQLFSLKVLDLSFTSIDSLPSSILNLSNLELLDLNNCEQLDRLPEELGNLVKLRFLDIGSTNIQMLPSRLGNLVKLSFLDIGCTNIEMLPSSLGNLTALKELRMSHCTKHVPKSIASLISLEVLHISCNKLTPHPNLFDFRDLTKFTKLQILELDCSSIELHESTEIDWSCWEQLKQLRLHVLTGIPSVFSKIFENMVQLNRLELEGNYKTLLGITIPPTVEDLMVCSFSRLPNFQNFQNLKICEIDSCSIQTLQIGKTIQDIYIGSCYNLKQLIWPDDYCALKRLRVVYCEDLKSVGIGKETHLKYLEIVELKNLTSLEELGEEHDRWNRETFPALHTFDISNIESSETCIQRLENLRRVLSLK